MEVTLINHTPLWVASTAIRKCWDSSHLSDTGNTNDTIGEKDRALIHRVGNKFKHASTLEHITYNFDIDGISRACLQELARHRMANLSVKSSRYTLKELKEAARIVEATEEVRDNIINFFCVLTDNKNINDSIAVSLSNLQLDLISGISNDIAKYCMPEAYKTSLVWTINARSLQNFLSLRTNKAALWEIQELAHNVYEALPEEHKYLFEEYIHDSLL